MFQFKFGIVWSLITIPIFSVMMLSPSTSLLDKIMLAPFAILFLGIGIYLIVIGSKKIKKDKETNKNGILTYGMVLFCNTAGVGSVNEQTIKAVQIIVFDPNTNTTKLLKEELPVGLAYNPGTFFKLKLYKDDVNIIETINMNSIPKNVLEAIYIAKTEATTDKNNIYKYVEERKQTLKKETHCLNCGAPIKEGADFCDFCGVRLF